MPGERILIVDDEPSLRRALRATLTALGFETTEAATGEQALALHGSGRFDFVLLDVNMPGIGGIETCRELRRREHNLQILILSVRDRKEDKAIAFQAGADAYFTKPFSISDLLARLRAPIA